MRIPRSLRTKRSSAHVTIDYDDLIRARDASRAVYDAPDIERGVYKLTDALEILLPIIGNLLLAVDGATLKVRHAIRYEDTID